MSAAPMMAKKMECNAPRQVNFSKSSINNNNNIILNKNNANNEIKNGLTRLIMSQDIIEGAWNENEETKKIINIITKNKFDLINNKVKGLNKDTQETKIIFTIMDIYYLMTKHSDKLNDYRLVINKAKKYLMSQGIKYEEFIVEI